MSRARWVWLVAVVAAAAAIRWYGKAGVQSGTSEDVASAEKSAPVVRAPTPKPVARLDPPASGAEPAEGDPPPDLVEGEMRGLGSVDLEEVRKAIPDNLYWKLAAPTKDPHLLEERDADSERLNVQYGKVLSGIASEDEIRAYYDDRAKRSGDYVEFASYLLDHYKDQLSDQDLTLLNLAIRLHRARLEEIPRKVEEALARKHQQDAAREAWLADQAAFGGSDSDSQ